MTKSCSSSFFWSSSRIYPVRRTSCRRSARMDGLATLKTHGICVTSFRCCHAKRGKSSGTEAVFDWEAEVTIANVSTPITDRAKRFGGIIPGDRRSRDSFVSQRDRGRHEAQHQHHESDQAQHDMAALQWHGIVQRRRVVEPENN